MSTLSENLLKTRKNKKMPRHELSEKTGISISSIRRYESGDRSPNMETLEKIANALSVDVNQLLGRETLGDRLKAARIEKGLTISDMAAAVGVNDMIYQKYEDDVSLPPGKILQKIFTLLGFDETDVVKSMTELSQINKKIEPVPDYSNGFTLQTTKEKINDRIDILNDVGQQKLLNQADILVKVPEFQKTHHDANK